MIPRRRRARSRRSSTTTAAILLATLLTASLCAADDVQTEVVSPRMLQVPAANGGVRLLPDEAVAGQAIVQIAPGTSRAEIEAMLKRLGASIVRTIPNTPLAVVSLPDGMTVVDGVTTLAAEPAIRAAEPDRIDHLTVVPNDPLYASQYHWPLMDSPTGWDINTGAANVIVAVIDSGADLDHEDLAGKYWVNSAEQGGTPGVDDDGNGFVDDINGWDFRDNDNDPDAGPPDGATVGTDYEPGLVSHGIHVAGLIGAKTDNATGVAGHDWNCQLMALRVASPLGSIVRSDTLAAMQYAIDNGADVINLSLSGGYGTSYDPVIANARAAGVTVVAAAGNSAIVFTDDPMTWQSPVCNDGPNPGVDNFVIGVAATDSGDVAAYFTNRDASSYSFVDVSAPGVNVLSTWYYDPDFSGLDVAYNTLSGTSMACPIVAGLAALVKAQHPGFSPDDITRQLRDSAEDIDDRNPLVAGTLGTGRVNTATALGLNLPPEPIDDLQAFDTPDDEGGSITLTWTLPDDHEGQDIVRYDILRAPESGAVPGTPGVFTQIDQLDPGQSGYIDTTVADVTPYWYRVVSLDAANAVPSNDAGPAEARDDLPPPAIENLAAVDTPADEGGSISLSWVGYDEVDDVVEYRIYRAESSFAAVAGMTPIATLPSGVGQHYDDETTEDGVQYWYAVTAVDDWDNEVEQVVAVGPVVSNPNFTFNYPPGLSIISIGALPAAPDGNQVAEILGVGPGDSVDFAWWDPAGADGAGQYVVWSQQPNSPAFTQALGRAWWMKTDEAIIAEIAGQAAGEGAFPRPVVAGWNMVGNPFPTLMDFGATTVTDIGQGTAVDLTTSNQLGFTRDYAWAYDPFVQSYRLVTAADMPFATSVVEPGRGVLFLARRPATLLLHRNVAAAQLSEREAESFDGWALQLTAEAGGIADTDNFLGVSTNAAVLSGVISPPRPDADLDLYFVRPNADGSRLATDFVSMADGWTIRVACGMPGATVRLSWPDLSQLPADLRPVLTDTTTGRTIYLRTSTGYSYEAGDQPDEREFTLHVADREGALAIGALSLATTGGRTEVVYNLTADASVDVAVLNIAGRVVRRVLTGREQAAGPQQVAWDGRNHRGAPAPAGTYLVRVRARAASGQQVTAVRALQLER